MNQEWLKKGGCPSKTMGAWAPKERSQRQWRRTRVQRKAGLMANGRPPLSLWPSNYYWMLPCARWCCPVIYPCRCSVSSLSRLLAGSPAACRPVGPLPLGTQHPPLQRPVIRRPGTPLRPIFPMVFFSILGGGSRPRARLRGWFKRRHSARPQGAMCGVREGENKKEQISALLDWPFVQTHPKALAVFTTASPVRSVVRFFWPL